VPLDNDFEKADRARMSSAASQARSMSQGDLDSQSLAACELAAIDKWNPQLNAFVQRAHPENLTGQQKHSFLSGTSFAVKDNIDVIGLPTHAGLLALRATAATRDATVVARLKQAGLVFTGKLNMSPMALGASTHNSDFGDCFNPHRAGFSAGGSSGGSASAVAAGLVGIALGTDTMGSVRLPAALCGVVGFKPSWGRLPVDGLTPLCAMLDHIGVLSRSVEDAALAFSILCADSLNENERFATQASVPDDSSSVAFQGTAIRFNRPGFAQSNVVSDSVRLGVVQNTSELQLQPEVESTFKTACEQLTAHGFTLNPVDMSNLKLSGVRRAGLMLCEAELLTTLEGIYPDHRRQLPRDLIKFLDFIQKQSAKTLGRAVAKLAESRYRFETCMDGLDAIVLPTCAHTAFSMSGSVPSDVADLTVVANVMGAPAISLPLPISAGGLPTGLQLVGRYGQDEALLALSSEVESMLTNSR
jgi:Asp-tRNA(Asn)/Glu-tRNA(Gln) amidotransferase A subunit family amidase